jgi:SPP1 gp7 family putative phage head morphogenesis protein
MPDEQEEGVDSYLDAFIAAYILSLYTASAEVMVSESYYALQTLNSARDKAGLEAIKGNSEKFVSEALDRAKKYRKMLEDRQGSYVVKELEGAEKLVFEPWLQGLREDTKKQLLDVFSQATKEEWPSSKITEELNKIEELTIKKRVKVTAFTETRTMQYQMKTYVWKELKLEYVKRIAAHGKNTCEVCEQLDGQIFNLGDEPPLSHPNCQCDYEPYYSDKDLNL